MLVAIAAVATAMIGIAQQGAPAVPTIHIGTIDFASGTLTVPDTGLSKAVLGIVLIEGTNGSGESGVFQVDLLSGKSTVVVAGARASFISEDRRRLYFFRGEGAHHELVEHDLSSRRERTVVSYEHAPEIPESAYVSPDRTRVYYRVPDMS